MIVDREERRARLVTSIEATGRWLTENAHHLINDVSERGELEIRMTWSDEESPRIEVKQDYFSRASLKAMYSPTKGGDTK